MQDLIGIFGGIVGLFMGFSLLSAAELIYFFTIRLWVEDNKKHETKKSKKIGIHKVRASQPMRS